MQDKTELENLYSEELYMMNGIDSPRDIIDVPVGPMRQLKLAPAFSFKAT